MRPSRMDSILFGPKQNVACKVFLIDKLRQPPQPISLIDSRPLRAAVVATAQLR